MKYAQVGVRRTQASSYLVIAEQAKAETGYHEGDCVLCAGVPTATQDAVCDHRCEGCGRNMDCAVLRQEGEDMKVGQAFPGNYIKAADLNHKKVHVVISECKLEDIGGDQKPVLYFEGKERGLVLNKTNANMIAEILGTDEMDDWSGQRIMLYPSKTDFQGKRVDCIRVEAAPKGAARPVAAPAPAPLKAAAPDCQASDEDVPF